jgi:hypothetical protein
MFEITLPVGALVIIGAGNRCRYVGDSKFVSDEPIWTMEGRAEESSQAHRDWKVVYPIRDVNAALTGDIIKEIAMGEIEKAA